jgi:hypothetical protein
VEEEAELLDLAKLGVETISEEDYLCVPAPDSRCCRPCTTCKTTLLMTRKSSLRSSQYRYWLREERGRYLDELSSNDAHKYFRRFVRVRSRPAFIISPSSNDSLALPNFMLTSLEMERRGFERAVLL